MTRRWIEAIGTALAAVAMAGCGAGNSMTATQNPSTPVTTIAISPQGEVFGGAQPVTGMTLQLYDAGSSGYGSTATGLFSSPPTTNSGGSFTFPAYTCPHASDQVYLVGTGGDPVAGNSTYGNANANPNLALMVALGTCSSLNAGTHIRMNELTTVAAIWALTPFMSGNTQSYLKIGTSSTNAAGLQLAFAAANEIVNTSNGTFPGTLPAGATLPTSELNTLADILEACIDSKGGTALQSNPCGALFGDAPSGTGYPTDTITAAMNIALNPARNVSALYTLASATASFLPDLSSAPNAWTVAIKYTGGGLNAPATIAADQSGNIWVGSSGSNAVSLFDNQGNTKLGTTGTTLGGKPGGIAIDLSGNAWVTSSDNQVYELNKLTGTLSGTQLSGNGIDAPKGIAFDPLGQIWVANTANGSDSISFFNPTGGTSFIISGSPIASPAGVVINGNANVNCANCH
jgi:streptogramin lyase